MAINKVQFIAYEINTFPIELITGGCLYKGLPDPATDAKARVNSLKMRYWLPMPIALGIATKIP
ncbi:MAG: hypothetical protein CTY34_01945 [Methylobacter sp.]|nr:MAG: hypothetical protein CTY34_01945 [Methylobacter sp.]